MSLMEVIQIKGIGGLSALYQIQFMYHHPMKQTNRYQKMSIMREKPHEPQGFHGIVVVVEAQQAAAALLLEKHDAAITHDARQLGVFVAALNK